MSEPCYSLCDTKKGASMANLFKPETWGELPPEAIAKLEQVRQLLTRENERLEEPTELDWETEF